MGNKFAFLDQVEAKHQNEATIAKFQNAKYKNEIRS